MRLDAVSRTVRETFGFYRGDGAACSCVIIRKILFSRENFTIEVMWQICEKNRDQVIDLRSP